NVDLLEDLERNRDARDIMAAAKTLRRNRKPLLVVAGEQDLTTKPEEAEKIAFAAGAHHTELYLIPHAGHTFGAEHPFRGMTPALTNVLELCTQFFENNLV